jgi:protein TonB
MNQVIDSRLARRCRMFENLMESSPVRERSLASSLLSLGCHAALATAAVIATRTAVDAAPANPAAPDLPYVHLPATRPTPVRPSQAVVPSNSAPRFSPIAVPTVVPVGIPPMEFDGPSGEALQRLLGMPDHDPTTPDGPPLYGRGHDSVLTNLAVDEPVRWLSGPTPDYPAALRTAGIEGVVMVRMVVDTLGRVEEGTVVVVSSTHLGFEAAAIAAVIRARFIPARLAGRPVRQLVQQSVRFRLD